MKISRRRTRPVRVGRLVIGGRAPVSVQSMTKTDTRDADATLAQIRRLARAGCELVRVAVPDDAAARRLHEICRRSPLPVCADIHFRASLAHAALAAGVAKLRINPGTIGTDAQLETVLRAARDRGVPVRIGINTGSLLKTGRPDARTIVGALARALRVAERAQFDQLVISAKAPDLATTVDAYQAIARRWPWPLHLGLTEAGLPFAGAIRSSATLALLLARGIGDTIRVSLAGDPVWEVVAGYEILDALGLRRRGPRLIVCPTCGRCEVDLVAIARRVERGLAGVRAPLTVAVMGCAVNGPGEARQADFGIAAGRRRGLVFARGRIVRSVRESALVDALLREIETGLRPT